MPYIALVQLTHSHDRRLCDANDRGMSLRGASA